MLKDCCHYTTLGIQRFASKEAIVMGYRRMAMRWHPDRHKEEGRVAASEEFKKIQAAYSVLSDDYLRSEYDLALKQSDLNYRSSNQSQNKNNKKQQDNSGKNEKQSSDYSQSKAYEEYRINLPRGKDVSKTIYISIDEAKKGTLIDINEQYSSVCDECNGYGGYAMRCNMCHGSGKLFSGNKKERCQTCDGNGRKVVICTKCNGSGSIDKRHVFAVKVPPGVVGGSILKVKGRGRDSKHPDGLPGDLEITIRIKVPDGWRVNGIDLHGVLKIPFSVALLGGDENILLPDGRILQISVPARSNSGRKIRLVEQGLFSASCKKNGDVLLIVQIVLPKNKKKLSREIEQMLRELDS